MEYDHEFSLRLINEYRRLEILWNPGYVGYFYKDKKEDAWDLLSERMGRSVKVLKAKMDSLKGSYRREKTRTKSSSGTGKGRSEVYKSQWFAFESLQFLDDKDTPRRTVSNVRNVSEGDDVQIMSNNNLPNEDETTSSVDQQFVNAPLPPRAQPLEPNHAINQTTLMSQKKRGMKRKTAEEDEQISEAFGYLKKITEKPKDQYSSFGEYIVHKIRTLPQRERVIAMQRINTILFEMEMNSMSQHEQTTYTPHLTNEPSTSSAPVNSTLHCEQPTYTPLLTNQASTSSTPVNSTLHCEQPTYTPLLTNQASTSSTPVHSTLHCEQPTYTPLLTNQASTSSTPVHSTLHCEQPTYTPLLTNEPSTSSAPVNSTLHCEQPTYTPLLTNQASTSSTPVHSTLHCEQPTYTPLLTNQPSTSSAPVHSTLHCEQPKYTPLLTNEPSTSSAPVHSTLHYEQPTYTPLLTNQSSTSCTPITPAVPPQTLFNPFNYYLSDYNE